MNTTNPEALAQYEALKKLRTRIYGAEGMLSATADFLETGGRIDKKTRASIVKDLRSCEALLNEVRANHV